MIFLKDFTSEHYSSLDEARISYARIFEEASWSQVTMQARSYQIFMIN